MTLKEGGEVTLSGQWDRANWYEVSLPAVGLESWIE